jgi:hypothetical protein
MREKDSLSRSMTASVSSCQFVQHEQVHQFYDVGPGYEAYETAALTKVRS